MKLLALDTASEWCSVAIHFNGEVRTREALAERGHGGHVLTLIDALLAEAGIALRALDAIAFGCGPGAFTGVRLAASITQGLAFSAGLPVIPVSDLRALAQQAMAPQAMEQMSAAPGQAPTRVLVCHDARMGEVYWAGFEAVGGFARAATAEAVARPEALLEAALAWINTLPTCAAGSGFAAYPALSASLAMLAPTLAELRPRALEVASLAAHDGLARAVPPEQALPVYVRNNVAVAPNQAGGGQA